MSATEDSLDSTSNRRYSYPGIENESTSFLALAISKIEKGADVDETISAIADEDIGTDNEDRQRLRIKFLAAAANYKKRLRDLAKLTPIPRN